MPYPPGVTDRDIDRLTEDSDWREDAYGAMTWKFIELLENSPEDEKWAENELDDCQREGMMPEESGSWVENKYWEDRHEKHDI